MNMATVVFSISAHGLGHLAQVAPVIRCLREARPGIATVIRSGLPRERLEARIPMPFVHQRVDGDFGYVMHNAIDIDLDATLVRYLDLHADWEGAVAAEAGALSNARADLVVSNVAYLPLAAAHAAGIPSLAFCSLNWAELFAHYFGRRSEAKLLLRQMLAAYRQADEFLRVSPSMPMADLSLARVIAPIATRGRPDRDRLLQSLGIASGSRVVLVAMGGIEFPLQPAAWPRMPGMAWLIAGGGDWGRDDVCATEGIGLAFPDLLASVDAVVTKPGYGIFVEAATACVPILYVPRGHWPEEPYLTDWLQHHARCARISREALQEGCFIDELEDLWQRPLPPRPVLGGESAVVARLLDLLDRRSTDSG